MDRPPIVKPGETPPTYDDILLSGEDPNQPDQTKASAPWWNVRYWRKRCWFGIIITVIAVAAIIIGVIVSVNQKNRYPDYSALTYKLVDTYSGENFFDQFNYFTGYDPASGFVHYVPQEQASSLNLTYASSNTAVLRVDTSVGPGDKPDASTGRFSVRVESKKTYNSGLFIFDIKHTPYGCGTWPALWLSDRWHWPAHGEIDVMEATNNGTGGTQMTLHTTGRCTMNSKRKQTGSVLQSNCDHAKNRNAGCGVVSDKSDYGTTFNEAGGGIMAMEWRDAGIRMWQFGRQNIPSDINNKVPDPSTWGFALADFPGTHCDMSSHFKNNSIIANIDLCGDLPLMTWESSGCFSNCTNFVANYPEAFTNAYWEFGAFHVYQAS
ncbi:concanavalin A-like lectin/glucanase domain-containing protein [Mariannaea sp. PMI_226]|nr:concanavalin A-like lectin/glucanase domain-containing protein [Mariannaea sp. PMI_226]